MKHAAVLIACALPLAACNDGGQPEVEARNASVAEVAEQVRTATKEEMFVRPGKWQSQITVEEISMPGIPPEMAQQMKAMIAQREKQSAEQCLTEENARRPKEEFFAGKNNACRYDHFKMGGGKIDAKMRCQASGVTQIMEMDGTYSPESYTMRMATRSDGGQGAAGGMQMRMRVESKRIGECDAKAAG
jgi:hypothetical protein